MVLSPRFNPKFQPFVLPAPRAPVINSSPCVHLSPTHCPHSNFPLPPYWSAVQQHPGVSIRKAPPAHLWKQRWSVLLSFPAVAPVKRLNCVLRLEQKQMYIHIFVPTLIENWGRLSSSPISIRNDNIRSRIRWSQHTALFNWLEARWV